MPYEIILDLLPAGIALTAARKGEKVKVLMREFTSSEDGDTFIQRLEGMPNDLLTKLPPEAGIRPSMVDQLFAVIRPDKSATIYINELPIILKVRTKYAKKRGDPIHQDDIADIESLSLEGISIPEDAGILFIFSIGWRKGLYFDFRALGTPPIYRDYNLEILLGHYYGYLGYQHLFKISENEWQTLFDQQWFPFITLKNSTIQKILNHIRNEWEVDELLTEIAKDVTNETHNMITRWSNNLTFQPHFELIRHAAEKYLQQDYITFGAS